MRFFKYILSLIFLVVLLAGPNFAQAGTTLPTLMVGQTKVTQFTQNGEKVYYGGYTGNEAVFNGSPNITGEFYSNINLKAGLAACLGGDLTKIISCYIFKVTPQSNGVKLFRSRTRVSGKPILETAALYYGSRLAVGDIYADKDIADNFSVMGRSLAVSPDKIDNSDALWKVGEYVLNGQSQSDWIEGSQKSSKQMDSYQSKLEGLASTASAIPPEILEQIKKPDQQINFYLQGGDEKITTDSNQVDAAKFPEGKVWFAKDFVVGRNTRIIYHGLGSILVEGNIVFDEGAGILAADSNSDFLGLIVLDNN